MKIKCSISLVILMNLFYAQVILGQVWRPLDQGLNNTVFAMCVDSQNNQLYVGGHFTKAGSIKVQNLSIWDGNTWLNAPDMQDQVNALIYFKGHIYVALDNGWVGYIQDNDFVIAGTFDNYVSCFALYKDTLYAGGHFTTAYGFFGEDDREVNHIARFDSIGRWVSLGKGVTGPIDPEVEAMHEYNGDLVAGGFFNMAGDSAVKNIARWDGTNWRPMKKGLYDPDNEYSAYVDAMDTFQGKLVVGGEFHQAGSIPCHSLATWSGESWDTLEYVVTNSVRTIYSSFGNLYVSGIIDDGLSAWNGVNWYQLNWGGAGDIFSFRTFQGHIYAGGGFYQLKDSLNEIAYLDYATSAGSIVSDESFLLFPNPVSGKLIINYNISQPAQLLLSDPYGRTLKSFTISPASKNEVIDVHNLASGMYLVALQSAGKRISQRVMVVR
ncbi:MAG: T9SS type A sorting domain-containing protein [Chitinophagales bacterium]|nr:T9SS type A sorting domain-containing protein [Chitinophagales bacterium]